MEPYIQIFVVNAIPIGNIFCDAQFGILQIIALKCVNHNISRFNVQIISHWLLDKFNSITHNS